LIRHRGPATRLSAFVIVLCAGLAQDASAVTQRSTVAAGTTARKTSGPVLAQEPTGAPNERAVKWRLSASPQAGDALLGSPAAESAPRVRKNVSRSGKHGKDDVIKLKGIRAVDKNPQQIDDPLLGSSRAENALKLRARPVVRKEQIK